MTTQGTLDHPTVRTLGTVALLLAFLLCGSAALAEEAAEMHEFVGARKCKSCHEKDNIGNQYQGWLDSAHAKAWDTLATDKAKEWAKKAGLGDPQTEDKCVKCHITAHGVDEEWIGTRYSKEEGVSCESCHGAGRDYRKKDIMIDRDAAIAKGMIIPDEALCLSCHNDESPAWDPNRYTLADGSKSGFDFEQAVKKILHPVPEGYDPLAEGEAD